MEKQQTKQKPKVLIGETKTMVRPFGVCLVDGNVYYGQSLRNPKNQYCLECGAKLFVKLD